MGHRGHTGLFSFISTRLQSRGGRSWQAAEGKGQRREAIVSDRSAGANTRGSGRHRRIPALASSSKLSYFFTNFACAYMHSHQRRVCVGVCLQKKSLVCTASGEADLHCLSLLWLHAALVGCPFEQHQSFVALISMVYVVLFVCVFVCVRACVRVCVCACLCVVWFYLADQGERFRGSERTASPPFAPRT